MRICPEGNNGVNRDLEAHMAEKLVFVLTQRIDTSEYIRKQITDYLNNCYKTSRINSFSHNWG